MKPLMILVILALMEPTSLFDDGLRHYVEVLHSKTGSNRPANLAVDDDLFSCSITLPATTGSNPWWQMTMDMPRFIKTVTISMDADSIYISFIKNIYVYMSNSEKNMEERRCNEHPIWAYKKLAGPTTSVFTVNCTMIAKYVTIIKDINGNFLKQLILCEVTLDFMPDIKTDNLAYGMETDQYGSKFSDTSRFAVDEDENTCSTVLGKDKGVWWRVKFNERHHIKGGRIRLTDYNPKSEKLSVYAYGDERTFSNQECQTDIESTAADNFTQIVTFTCNRRSVKFVHVNTDSKSFTICELSVAAETEKTACADEETPCNERKSCIPKEELCDGVKQCPSGIDERNCKCEAFQYKCHDGPCIPNEWLCDGTVDCPTADDEGPYCKTKRSCPLTHYKCAKRSMCVELKFRCDGISQCEDHSDENNCVMIENNKGTRVIINGTEGYVCVKNWNGNFSKDMCEMANKRLSLNDYFREHYIQGNPLKYRLRENAIKRGTFLTLKDFEIAKDCSFWVIRVHCFEEEKKTAPVCGDRLKNDVHVARYMINGSPALDGEWPWMAQIIGSQGHLCGASIIRDNWVLTAAHCVDFVEDLEDIYIKVGSTKTDNPKTPKHWPSHIVLHPDYRSGDASYDVALVRLQKPVSYSYFTRPICLPNRKLRDITLMGYRYCVLTGFGKIDTKGKDPDTLMVGRMNIMTADACAINLASIGNESKRHYLEALSRHKFICAGSPPTRHGINVCHGDSGSPLVCINQDGNFIQVAIASVFEYGKRGEECTNSLFSRLDEHVDFINEVFANEQDIVNNCSKRGVTALVLLLIFLNIQL